MLKKYLETNELARRIFGKKEIEIIVKQLEGRTLSQSERNRLSRDIRPKFEAISELNQFKEEFKIQYNQENKKLIQRTVTHILSDSLKDDISAILLFGSSADNTFTSRSDIDICVLFGNISLKEATRFRIRITGSLPEEIDLQVFNILGKKIKREIARNHKVLFKQKSFDNMDFTIRHLKEDDYFIRFEHIFGVKA